MRYHDHTGSALLRAETPAPADLAPLEELRAIAKSLGLMAESLLDAAPNNGQARRRERDDLIVNLRRAEGRVLDAMQTIRVARTPAVPVDTPKMPTAQEIWARTTAPLSAPVDTPCGVIGYPNTDKRVCVLTAGHEGYHDSGDGTRWLGYHEPTAPPLAAPVDTPPRVTSSVMGTATTTSGPGPHDGSHWDQPATSQPAGEMPALRLDDLVSDGGDAWHIFDADDLADWQARSDEIVAIYRTPLWRRDRDPQEGR